MVDEALQLAQGISLVGLLVALPLLLVGLCVDVLAEGDLGRAVCPLTIQLVQLLEMVVQQLQCETISAALKAHRDTETEARAERAHTETHKHIQTHLRTRVAGFNVHAAPAADFELYLTTAATGLAVSCGASSTCIANSSCGAISKGYGDCSLKVRAMCICSERLSRGRRACGAKEWPSAANTGIRIWRRAHTG